MVIFVTILLILQINGIFTTDSIHVNDDISDSEIKMKSDDDGYDFLAIDQLFLNNPEYAKLLSDLQQHSFDSRWRKKRDTGDDQNTTESFEPAQYPEGKSVFTTPNDDMTTMSPFKSSTPRKLVNQDRRVTILPNRFTTKPGNNRNKQKVGSNTNNGNKVSNNGSKVTSKPTTNTIDSNTNATASSNNKDKDKVRFIPLLCIILCD